MKRTTAKRWLAATAAALLLCGCGPAARKAAPPAPTKSPQETVIAPVRFEQRRLSTTLADEKGRPIFEARADSLEVDDRTKLGIMRSPRFTFYDEGRPALNAKAGAVKVDYARKVVHLEGGVAGESLTGGYSFQAQRAEWDYGRKELTATGKVRLWRQEWEARGDVLKGDTALKRARLSGSPATLSITEQASGRPAAKRGR